MTVVVVFTSRRALANDDEYARHGGPDGAASRRQQPGFLELTSVRDPVTRLGITGRYFADHEVGAGLAAPS